MSERERLVDIIALEQYFKEHLDPCYDRDAGEGLEVLIDRGKERRPLTLQVFPDTGIARIRAGLADVTLRRARVHQEPASEMLWLAGKSEDEWTRLSITPKGGVIFASFPSRDVDIDQVVKGTMAQERKGRPAAPGLSEGARRDEQAEAATPLAQPASEAANRIEQERITLSGRLGMAPRFRTTKNDKLVCTFPLAVHDDAGATHWHDVVVFGERALKLQDSLQKGQEVEVIGYVHVKDVPGKDGELKEKRELWAAVVRKPKKGDGQ